jgi:hypothetical protein
LTALRYFFGQVLPVGRSCWTAVTATLLIDAVGTDYFSPQSVGLVVALVVFGLALSSDRSVLRAALVALGGLVLTVSHQLSPFIAGGVLTVLVLCRQVRPWWLPLLVLGPATGWTLLHGGAVERFLSLGQFGRPQNFRPPYTPAAPGLHRLPIVTATVAATLIGLGLLGVLALAVLVRRRRESGAWAIACCPAVGAALVLINPYGQEGVFRTAVFGIPWLAMLTATYRPAVRRVHERLLLFVALAVCTTTFLIASFGLDASNVSRPSDVSAFRHVAGRAAQQPQAMCYLLQLGAGDLPGPVPTRSTKFRILTDEDLGDQDGRRSSVPSVDAAYTGPQQASIDADRQAATITAQLLDYTGERVGAAQLYAIWSPAASAFQQEYAVRPPADFAALRDAFRRSPYWTVDFTRDGTVVFGFLPGRYPRSRS